MKNTPEKEPILKKERTPKEIIEELYQEKREELEKRELLTEKEKAIREKLEEEIVKIKLSPDLTDEAKKKAIQINSFDEKKKLEHLLALAEINGVAFAVAVARNMNDPYVLDTFHDILTRDGLYKKFKK